MVEGLDRGDGGRGDAAHPEDSPREALGEDHRRGLLDAEGLGEVLGGHRLVDHLLDRLRGVPTIVTVVVVCDGARE